MKILRYEFLALKTIHGEEEEKQKLFDLHSVKPRHAFIHFTYSKQFMC